MADTKIKYSKSFDYSKIDRGVTWRKVAANQRKKDSIGLSKETNKFSCPICFSNNNKKIVEIYAFNYVQCQKCTHVYIDQIPSLEIINSFYRKKNSAINKSPGDDLINTDDFHSRVKNICIPKIEFVLQSIKKQNPKWVDIGCGIGDLVYAANELNCDAIGYDVDEREINHGNKFGSNIALKEITSENASSLIGDADVVSLISVLEHIPNPAKLLKNISNNIKPTAKIVIEVPRFESISSVVNIVFPDLIARHMLPPNHIMLFTEDSFDRLLKIFNLKKRTAWYYGMDINELFGTVFSINDNVPKTFSNKMTSFFNEMQKVLDKIKFCDEMLIILEK